MQVEILIEETVPFAMSNDNVGVETSKLIPSGKGLHARRDFLEREEIFIVEGQLVNYSTLRTLQLTDDIHIDPVDKDGEPEPGYYLNHSCKPNAYSYVVEDNQNLSLRIYALNHINKGEEITVDYSFMETAITNSCICKCGSDYCRGKIIGFKDLGDEEIENYLSKNLPLSKHLKELYKRKKNVF